MGDPLKVCVGGTFECLHVGHRALLSRAMERADELLIGLTTIEFMLAMKGYSTPYDLRRGAIERFVQDSRYQGTFRITPLDDPFGPAVTYDLDAIVVSEETEPAANRINELRRASDLEPLEVIVMKMMRSEDGRTVSSTRIGRGEIDVDGHLVGS